MGAVLTPALAAFVHHALAFILFAAVMVQLVLLREPPTISTARSILRMDAVYGISATLLLVVGFIRVLHTEKGAGYYFQSAPFIAKLALFVAVGLISIYPTLKFRSWRKALASGAAPSVEPEQHRKLKLMIHTELTLLVIIMLCAALMSRGIGML